MVLSGKIKAGASNLSDADVDTQYNAQLAG